MLKNLINKIVKKYQDYKLTKVTNRIASKIPECEMVQEPEVQNIQVPCESVNVDQYTMSAYVSKTPKVEADENGIHYTFDNILGLTEIRIRNNKQTQDAFEKHLREQRVLARCTSCKCENCKKLT